jgi:hypothetical protein
MRLASGINALSICSESPEILRAGIESQTIHADRIGLNSRERSLLRVAQRPLMSLIRIQYNQMISITAVASGTRALFAQLDQEDVLPQVYFHNGCSASCSRNLRR